MGKSCSPLPPLDFFYRLRQFKPLGALGRDLVALLPVTADTFCPQIGQKSAWLASDVGTHVPGVSGGHQRLIDDLVDMGNPVIRCLWQRLDGGLPGREQLLSPVADPLHMTLNRYR